MRVVWARGDATVQHVVSALGPGREPAYTTIMTVMSRLAAKGLLRRQKEGRAYVYAPATPQHAVAGSLLKDLVAKLYAGSTTHAIEHLIEVEADVSDHELARLEALIRAKRRERER